MSRWQCGSLKMRGSGRLEERFIWVRNLVPLCEQTGQTIKLACGSGAGSIVTEAVLILIAAAQASSSSSTSFNPNPSKMLIFAQRTFEREKQGLIDEGRHLFNNTTTYTCTVSHLHNMFGNSSPFHSSSSSLVVLIQPKRSLYGRTCQFSRCVNFPVCNRTYSL